ncbi:arginine 2,3-aminomutase, partial [Rhizobium johnstonii]
MLTTDATAWDDWRWQLANSATTLEALKDQLSITPDEEEAFHKVGERYSFRATPYYLSLIEKDNPNDPIRLQAIPSI